MKEVDINAKSMQNKLIAHCTLKLRFKALYFGQYRGLKLDLS